jgi:CheY-like chemotaxis protein
MDVDMPVMDGLAATEMIRHLEKESGAHVPVIAVTAHATNGGRERCLEAGMDDFIAKPYRAEELYAAVDAWAAMHRRGESATAVPQE